MSGRARHPGGGVGRPRSSPGAAACPSSSSGRVREGWRVDLTEMELGQGNVTARPLRWGRGLSWGRRGRG